MLNLPERVTHAQAADTLRGFVQTIDALPAGSALVLDGAALRVFDSSVLGVLLAARRQAQARRVALSTQALPPRLRRLATLYGLEACL